MPVARELLLAELGERHLELHVARERLVRGAHQRVLEVVADAGQGAGADEIAAADLRLIAAHRVVLGMALGQPHLRPHPQRGAADAVTTAHVDLIGTARVEQVELDELDALILQIEQGTVDASAVGAQVARQRSRAQAARVTGRPVVLPVDPGEISRVHGPLAAPAARGVLADLAEESLAAIVRDGPQPALGDVQAGFQALVLGRAASDDERRAEEKRPDLSAHGRPPGSARVAIRGAESQGSEGLMARPARTVAAPESGTSRVRPPRWCRCRRSGPRARRRTTPPAGPIRTRPADSTSP